MSWRHQAGNSLEMCLRLNGTFFFVEASEVGLTSCGRYSTEAALLHSPCFKRVVGTVQGITLTWDILAIMAVYFVQGALGLARLATTFFFKDELHLDPAQVAALSGLFTLPWVFKPLYGFLSDALPIFGYRRYVSCRHQRRAG